jgi:hypothetical protein
LLSIDSIIYQKFFESEFDVIGQVSGELYNLNASRYNTVEMQPPILDKFHQFYLDYQNYQSEDCVFVNVLLSIQQY